MKKKSDDVWTKPFNITSVCREDILTEGIAPKEAILKLTDEEMINIAGKMENAYLEYCFWADLRIIARTILNAKKIK